MKALTNKTFRTYLAEAEKPVLVDYWADWCGPCHALAPHLERAALELTEEVEVVKLNIDENMRVARDESIQGIPTLVLYHHGVEMGRFSGARPTPMIVNIVRDLIQKFQRGIFE